MPDKIKDAYEAFKDTQIFIDENDFREQVKKDPKGVFDLFNEEESTKGVFVDYNDFESQLGLKKKETFGLGFGTASEASASTRPQAKVPFKSPSETNPNFTKPQPRLSAEEQQAQGMVTKQAKAEKALEFKEGVKQKLYDNSRYWLLQNKKEAQEKGMTLKGLQASRRKELANLLDEDEQIEANAIVDHLDAKKSGDDKRAGEALKQYYAAKNQQRAKFQSEMGQLQSEYDNIASRINNGELDPNFGQKTLSAIEQRKRNLESSQKAFLNPKKALNEFVSENATEIASVSKPTQTPYEQLEEYTNNLYAKVRQLKADLGYKDMGKGATLGGYAQDYVIRSQEGGGDLLDELYAEEFKLKNATKLLLLNRTPIPANETALGVIGKSFGNSLAPNLQKEQGTAQAIANNVKEIVQEANIGKQVYEEQQKFAEDEAKPYETYSAKWFAEPMGASLAIVPEFIVGSLVTEGALGLTKLGKMLSIAEKYGKVKGLNTTAKYVNAVNKNAAGKVADTIGKTFIKTQANGLKFGATSEVVSQLFPSQEDEINFTTGYFGGVIGKGVEGAVSSAAKNLFKVFGNKGAEAAKKISELGGNMKFMKDAPKTVLGELGEEFGESLGQIYQESDSWNEIKSKIDEQFGTLDKATQFVVQTAIMALNMGAGNQIGINLHKSSKDAYNQLPREERAKVDAILDDVKKEDTKVAEDVATQVEEELSSDKEIAEEIETIKQEDAEQPTTIEEEAIETPSSETVTDTIVSDGSATPTTVESTEVAPEVVSETVSDIEPPVVEQTTTDVGGVTAPDVSDIEYNNFIDTGEVSQETIEVIADKIIKGQPITERETSIYQAKASEIEQLLGTKEQTPTTKERTEVDAKPLEIKGDATTKEQVEENKEQPSESARKSENLAVSEREKEIQLLDTKKKIAQLEKELRKAPSRPSKGKPSQKQLRTQIRNYRDQLRELEGKPPRFKPKGSVLTRAIGRFQSEVDEGRLSNEERLVLDLIGRVSESDKDVMDIDPKQVANQKKKGVIVKDGLTIDQIVADFISENELSEDMAQDLRDYAIDFLSKKDAYEFMREVKERESTPDPDAVRDDEYYGYGYQLAEDLDMTVEEQDLLESEVAEILLSGKQLTDKQYAELQTQFAEEIESIRSGQETIDKGDDTKKGKGDKIQEDVEIFEQVLTINDTTKLKSSKKAKIKEVIESKADNDIISYIAENIDDIKAQLRDKVGLTTECKW